MSGTSSYWRPQFKRHGWKIITVTGNAKERGFQHGAILSKELVNLAKVMSYALKNTYETTLEDYIALCNRVARPYFDKKACCKEWREELEGMVEGALSKGVIITVDFLFSWNMYLGIDPFYNSKLNPRKNAHRDHCSAFIATGDATSDGKIVLAHNTHTEFIWATFSNIVQYVRPTKGNSFVMQTAPGLLCSSTDWFVCESGIVGCETTIADTTYLPKFGKPYFCRIRECMQYATSLDDCVKMMREDNAGDYPGGWMFGDTNTNEIMLLEVAQTVAEPRRTKSGVFYGANFAHDSLIRDKQTTNELEIHDLNTSIGSRNVRLDWLLNKVYWGKIDADTAKKIIADHYDYYKNKTRKGARSICKHSELEPRKTNRPAKSPFGAIDGKVVDTDMAKQMTFWGRWGSSCGRKYHLSRRRKATHPYVPDFKGEPWTAIHALKN